jgi:translocation and assembly module TamB
VKLSGRDVRPFHITGTLAGAGTLLGRLRAEAGVSWQSLQAMGCQIGPADMRGRLAEGWLRASPLEATLNQGRLRLEPSLRLHPAPLEVHLAKGRAIERAHLTPAVCAGGLGYALPVLADVAQAEGELSLDLDCGRLPLTDPARGEMAGRLIIHSAQVSPGPLVQELSALLKGPATLTLAKDNVVSFQVVNGRVYHSGLELHFPELTVRTSGSVGMDGSLSLVAELPVPPKWLGSSKLARAVAGQTIRLPIGGTLSKPKLDRQALRAASAQFARQATENVIRQEIDGQLKKEAENGLKKLFRRK